MSYQPPLIGITSSELRRRAQTPRDERGEPAQAEISLGLAYPQALCAAGGIPIILTPVPEADISSLLGRLDGVVFSGGPDLHPSAYAQEPHALLGECERELDMFELRLCAAARVAHIPVLGICRGLQVINVAAGGTLHQHLPDVVGTKIAHRQTESEGLRTHKVEIEAGTGLAEIMGAGSLRVNSFHHQAIDELGQGLRASARAADGIIEAVEGGLDEWVLAVQWHAESLIRQPRDLALFTALVTVAKNARQ
jgi:putative glutamine amidotransferase